MDGITSKAQASSGEDGTIAEKQVKRKDERCSGEIKFNRDKKYWRDEEDTGRHEDDKMNDVRDEYRGDRRRRDQPSTKRERKRKRSMAGDQRSSEEAGKRRVRSLEARRDSSGGESSGIAGIEHRENEACSTLRMEAESPCFLESVGSERMTGTETVKCRVHCRRSGNNEKLRHTIPTSRGNRRAWRPTEDQERGQ